MTSLATPDRSHQSVVTLNRRTIVRLLTGAVILLLMASLAGQVIKHGLGYDTAYGLVRLFYLDAEGNIPTFFSALLLLLAALLLAGIATLKHFARAPYRRHWAVLSLLFLLMAVDEAAGLHEMLNGAGRWLMGHHTTRIFHYGWVMFGLVMVVGVALSYLKFFLALPASTRIQFFTAAATLVGGAIGVEILEGYYSASRGGENSFQFSLFVTVEEGLEMAGTTIFINALLSYITQHHEGAVLKFRRY